MSREQNIVYIEGVTQIFGDYHGSYFDFTYQRDDPYWKQQLNGIKINRVYLGDYVDRGESSIEILTTLLCMKCNDPQRVIILRGNHETRKMSSSYNFLDECYNKYSREMYELFCNLFDTMPLCCIVSTQTLKFFLCHGGLSSHLRTLDDIMQIDRRREPPNEGLFCDLLWSDPTNNDFFLKHPSFRDKAQNITYLPNKVRRCSCLYGFKAINSFLCNNGLTAVIRGHQCVDKGIQVEDFGCERSSRAITVFGKTNYGDNHNRAGFIVLANDNIFSRTNDRTNEKEEYLPVLNSFDLSLLRIRSEIHEIMKILVNSAFLEVDDEDDDDSLFYSLTDYTDDDEYEEKDMDDMPEIAETSQDKSHTSESINIEATSKENISKDTSKFDLRKCLVESERFDHKMEQNEQEKMENGNHSMAFAISDRYKFTSSESMPKTLDELREYWNNLKQNLDNEQ